MLTSKTKKQGNEGVIFLVWKYYPWLASLLILECFPQTEPLKYWVFLNKISFTVNFSETCQLCQAKLTWIRNQCKIRVTCLTRILINISLLINKVLPWESAEQSPYFPWSNVRSVTLLQGSLLLFLQIFPPGSTHYLTTANYSSFLLAGMTHLWIHGPIL